MADSTARGNFVWHELLTTDTKSAAAFFSKVIGWKSKPWGEDASYTLFLSGDRQAAGLMTVPEDQRKAGAAPGWLSYISVPSVDESARLAASLGATIKKGPEDIPTVGRYAIVQDPQGAVFGLFAPAQARPQAAPSVGDFSWHELATTDLKAAFSFYQRLFGWEETSSMDMGGGLGTYQMFGKTKAGLPLGGMFTKPAQMPGPSNWLPYIKVPDAKKTAATIKKQGGQIINGPMEVPGGDWIAQSLDLQSAMFAVHSAKPAAAAAPQAKPAARTAAKKAGKAGKAKARKAKAGKAKAGKAKAGKAAKKSAARKTRKAAKASKGSRRAKSSKRRR